MASDSARRPRRRPPSQPGFGSKWQSLPTEAINPASLAIETASTSDIVDLMVAEDRNVVRAVRRERARIAVAVDVVTEALRGGGRLIFAGAGTSGRLGVLEAAEMLPTFGTSSTLVQAIMAGGHDAFFQSKEALDDSYEGGVRAVARIRPTKRDVLIGISASGMTPFVHGTLTRARKAGAKTVFVTCWPGTELQTFADVTIAPEVGAEVIAGSTRLKAGSATKMVLNMLTTIPMVRLGKTYGNLMVDVQTRSQKHRDRARRIIGLVTGLEYDDADALLRSARGNIKAAIVMQKTGEAYGKAMIRLKHARGSVREAIGEDAEPRLRRALNVAEQPVVKVRVAPRPR